MIQVSSGECWRLERGSKQQLIYVNMVSTTQDADPYLKVRRSGSQMGEARIRAFHRSTHTPFSKAETHPTITFPSSL